MKSKIHYLKITPEYFRDVQSGNKNFELRIDDRGFTVGDYLILQEWIPSIYTGREIQARIKYILRDCPEFGLMSGYAILSIELGFWFN